MNYFIFSSVTCKYYVHVHNWLFCLITLNWKQWLEIKNKPDKQKWQIFIKGTFEREDLKCLDAKDKKFS